MCCHHSINIVFVRKQDSRVYLIVALHVFFTIKAFKYDDVKYMFQVKCHVCIMYWVILDNLVKPFPDRAFMTG